MWRSNYEPLYLRILWRFGFDVPPPHFLSFFQAATVATVWFALAFGTAMWILVWSKQGWTVLSAIAIACATGAFWGGGMAIYYACDRRKYGLPTWASL